MNQRVNKDLSDQVRHFIFNLLSSTSLLIHWSILFKIIFAILQVEQEKAYLLVPGLELFRLHLT